MSDSLGDTSFLSVGLDIGTTTTHLVVSRLTVGPGDDPFGRHHLLDREVIHRGHIRMTPTIDGTLIDADAIAALVLEEYAAAGITAEVVLTGAVIVTGETALKQNAEQVAQRLAGESSSFAAAVAGANAEAILAGRGSGAADHSRRHHCCVLNVDVGGGTTNLAWFVNGQAVAAGAIRVGGRHLLAPASADSLDYRVATETARRYLGTDTAGYETMRHWIAHCGKLCSMAIRGNVHPSFRGPFMISWPADPPPQPDVVMVSGGIGELMARIDRGEEIDAQAFDDTGPRLATALHASFQRQGFAVRYPAEPIRATVIGAGQFSMMFSGETLWASAALLPLRNLPVVRLPRFLHEVSTLDDIAATIERQRALQSIDAGQVTAVVLPSLRAADWDTVVDFAGRLAEAAVKSALPTPWVFTMRDNFGRLLGQSMAERHPGHPLVVIDEIDLAEADFIDIGKPVERWQVLIPVVAKTLAFEKS